MLRSKARKVPKVRVNVVKHAKPVRAAAKPARVAAKPGRVPVRAVAKSARMKKKGR